MAIAPIPAAKHGANEVYRMHLRLNRDMPVRLSRERVLASGLDAPTRSSSHSPTAAPMFVHHEAVIEAGFSCGDHYMRRPYPHRITWLAPHVIPTIPAAMIVAAGWAMFFPGGSVAKSHHSTFVDLAQSNVINNLHMHMAAAIYRAIQMTYAT
ncbi:hypothetical protein PISMIDRAFT_22521 [Pisolithus microcarpus 441]|uniref:Uncharacterized protein n=1 Tax=Pisolithus microcarpus 441 TaxID=765257 RepID=A0A0C9YMX8_9AGAM|nr:hypothetical protein BKA83DRAFT_22521 [Pisolithus microcarpus]KIK26355.1 hypothetical protein PISMIDRAFT_22521 [Pisolithus microcarpus 441]